MFSVMVVVSEVDRSEVIGRAEVVVSKIVRSGRRCILYKWINGGGR
jgi:hypothetical protein